MLWEAIVRFATGFKEQLRIHKRDINTSKVWFGKLPSLIFVSLLIVNLIISKCS